MIPLISCQSITKSFGVRPLFKQISLGLLPEERLGLIGPNGSGKSTLLRILAGLDTPDSGEISRQKDLRLAYVPQEDSFPLEMTVEEVLNETLAKHPMENYERSAILNKTMNQVGFSDGTQMVGALSGGWKKRLALANAFVQNPDLLLLDEPTNHLDLEGVLWLETLLQDAPFAILMVSHDRTFLENVITHMIDLNKIYPEGYLKAEGAYSDFLDKKAAFMSGQSHLQQALESKVRREIDWLRRGAPARTTKAKGRIDSAGALIGELAEVKYRNAQVKNADLDFTSSKRQTKELIVARNLQKGYGDRTLFSGLSLTLSPGTRLGLAGPNGSGKTSLIRILTGEMEPDSGEVRRAERLRIVKFDQNRDQLDRNLSLRDALSPESDNVEYRGGNMHITAWAKRFLFRPEQLDMPVSSLSGGEQARVLIANLMRTPADVLILDEPTNDLDIPTLEVLEETLLEFPGALILVTHDRYLLDSVSTKLLALDGMGESKELAEYLQWERWYAEKKANSSFSRAKSTPSKGAVSIIPDVLRKLSTLEQKELNSMEATITKAEDGIVHLHETLLLPEIVANYQKSQVLWDQIEKEQEQISKLYKRWEELESRKAGSSSK